MPKQSKGMIKKEKKEKKEIPSFQRDGESSQDIYNRSADLASEENQQNQNMHDVYHFKTRNLSKKIGVRSCTCRSGAIIPDYDFCFRVLSANHHTPR